MVTVARAMKSTTISLSLVLALSVTPWALSMAQQSPACNIYWRTWLLPYRNQALQVDGLEARQAMDAKLSVFQALNTYNVHDPHSRWFEERGLSEVHVADTKPEKRYFVTFHVAETNCPNSRDRFKQAVCADRQDGIRGCCMASVSELPKRLFRPNYVICNVNATGKETEFYWVSERMFESKAGPPTVPVAVTEAALQLGLYNMSASVALILEANKVNLYAIENLTWDQNDGGKVTFKIDSKLSVDTRVVDETEDFCESGMMTADCVTAVTLARCNRRSAKRCGGSQSQLAGASGWTLEDAESECEMACSGGLTEVGRTTGSRRRCPSKRLKTNRNLYCCTSMLCQ